MRYSKRRVIKRRQRLTKRRHTKNCKCNRCCSRSKRNDNSRRIMKGG